MRPGCTTVGILVTNIRARQLTFQIALSIVNCDPGKTYYLNESARVVRGDVSSFQQTHVPALDAVCSDESGLAVFVEVVQATALIHNLILDAYLDAGVGCVQISGTVKKCLTRAPLRAVRCSQPSSFQRKQLERCFRSRSNVDSFSGCRSGSGTVENQLYPSSTCLVCVDGHEIVEHFREIIDVQNHRQRANPPDKSVVQMKRVALVEPRVRNRLEGILTIDGGFVRIPREVPAVRKNARKRSVISDASINGKVGEVDYRIIQIFHHVIVSILRDIRDNVPHGFQGYASFSRFDFFQVTFPGQLFVDGFSNWIQVADCDVRKRREIYGVRYSCRDWAVKIFDDHRRQLPDQNGAAGEDCDQPKNL